MSAGDNKAPSQHQQIGAAARNRREHEDEQRLVERVTCTRLSEEARWRGAGGDLWPLRILFWRILSDGRTVRMRTRVYMWLSEVKKCQH